jgi:hypothetical protein
MSMIDKQRVAAVRKLEQLGYTFATGDWHAPAGITAPAPTSAQAGAMDAVLGQRADQPERCPERSDEEAEFATITDAVQAYQAVRWPNGRVDGGKKE